MSCTEPKTELVMCANPKCENAAFVPVGEKWMCDDCQDATKE